MFNGPYVMKLFTWVMHECSYKLVLGKLFQPCLMFVSKAGAYPREAPFKCSTLE